MTPTASRLALSLLICVGFFFALFGKAIGLPGWTEPVGAMVGGLSAIGQLVIQRRAKKHVSKEGAATPQQRTLRRWLLVAVVALSALSSPFWLPAIGVTLPFPQLIISAIVSCAFYVVIILIATRDIKPKV